MIADEQTQRLEALRAQIEAGRTSGDGKHAEAVFDQLEAKYLAQAKARFGDSFTP